MKRKNTAKKEAGHKKTAIGELPFAAAEQKLSQEKYQLKLYIAGATPRSTTALLNIRKVCEEHLQGRYQLEVIDIYQQPVFARDHQIIAAPTLIKHLPLPLRKLVGDMSDSARLLFKLDVGPRS